MSKYTAKILPDGHLVFEFQHRNTTGITWKGDKGWHAVIALDIHELGGHIHVCYPQKRKAVAHVKQRYDWIADETQPSNTSDISSVLTIMHNRWTHAYASKNVVLLCGMLNDNTSFIPASESALPSCPACLMLLASETDQMIALPGIGSNEPN
mgnify:CR=1 FL=1